MLIGLVACIKSDSDKVQDIETITTPDDKISDSNQDDDNKILQGDVQPQSELNTCEPRYFFIGGSLIGSYDDDGWHSQCDTDFYAKELLNQDSYYVYEGQELIGVSKQIVWQTEDAFCLGSFEAEDAPEKFAKYGKLCHDKFRRIFDLPLKLGDELSNLKIPGYSFVTDFVFSEEGVQDNTKYTRFVTNSNVDMFPQTLKYGVDPTPEGYQSLLNLFKENDMDKTIPDFSFCVQGDFDNDDKDEYFMIANNPRGENGWPIIVGEGEKDKVGTFSAMLYQEDNGIVQILHSDMRLMPGKIKFNNGYIDISNIDYCHKIDFATAADLNGDGIFEIIVNNVLWEGGYTAAFSQNEQGVYTVVMRSNWGL